MTFEEKGEVCDGTHGLESEMSNIRDKEKKKVNRKREEGEINNKYRDIDRYIQRKR